MYLSYSGYKTYKQCPSAYWHSYIGKTNVEEPQNCVPTLFGIVIGKIFEEFYNHKIWRDKQNFRQILSDRVEPVAREAIQDKLSKGHILQWVDARYRSNPKSFEDLVQSVRDTIPNGLTIIRENRLLGVDAKAEVKLDCTIRGHRLGGRADFLMKRSGFNDTVITDGKGSVHLDKYVDETQLLWYSMLYRQKYGVLPDKVGFIYWRAQKAQIDWMVPKSEDVNNLRDSVLQLMTRIESSDQRDQRVFLTRATPSNCKFCPFLSQCSDGRSMLFDKPPPTSVEEDDYLSLGGG